MLQIRSSTMILVCKMGTFLVSWLISRTVLTSVLKMNRCCNIFILSHTNPAIQGWLINTSRQGQKGRHFAYDTFKRIFLNKNVRISFGIWLNVVLKGPVNNIPALVQIMVWCRDQAASHYLDQRWLDCRRIYASLGLNELTMSTTTTRGQMNCHNIRIHTLK